MTDSSVETAPSPSDLDESATMTVADALKIILANSYAVYLKTKNFHWHVSGPYFRDYHLLLDEQAAEILAATDAMAERAQRPVIRPSDRSAISPATRRSRTTTRSSSRRRTCWQELRADNLHMVESLRRAKDVADQAKGQCDLRPDRYLTDEAERRAWFLSKSADRIAAQRIGSSMASNDARRPVYSDRGR